MRLVLKRGPLQTRKRFKSRALVTNSDSAAHRYRHSTRPSFFSWSTRPEHVPLLMRAARRRGTFAGSRMGCPPRIPSPVANSAPYDSISARAAEALSSLSRNAALPSTLRGSVGWWSAQGRPQAWV